MAWSGQPIALGDLLLDAPHGIVDQSLHSRLGAEPTNGDGFGLGWYDVEDRVRPPGLFRTTRPAWSDPNLRELARHVESPRFLAHVRAAIGSPVQATNCHPFRHGRWLFVHNGYVGDFPALRRDLLLAVDPELFPAIEGSTDTEVVFHLALTFGLEQDPPAALAAAVGLVEAAAAARGVEPMVQATFGVSDGTTLWAVRYATTGRARSLFVSEDADTVRRLHPHSPRLARLASGDRLVVSEPFSDLPGVWHEVPQATALTVGADGVVEHEPFSPAPEG